MIDFQDLRRKMVDNQIRPGDVTDHSLIKAFGKVPREMFVPAENQPFAYADRTIAIRGAGTDSDSTEIDPNMRYMPVPVLLARLIQALEISDSDVILDVACGTGYAAAILSELAGSVLAIEQTEEMAALAEANLAEFGADSVAVTTAPLIEGLESEGPFDAILVAAGAEIVPEALKDQLNEGGRLVIVECDGPTGRAHLYRRAGADVSGRPLFDAVLPVLPELARKPEFAF